MMNNANILSFSNGTCKAKIAPQRRYFFVEYISLFFPESLKKSKNPYYKECPDKKRGNHCTNNM